MSLPEPHYWAFISYSSKDGAVARRLHRALEHYHVPRTLVGRPSRDGTPIPKRLFPIFRDRDELPLSSDLGDAIEDALRASRCLIVLCSPTAAVSRWVNEEVRYFKSIGGEGRILAIILSGTPNAADHGAPAAQECFPPALRHRVGAHGGLTDERCEPVGGDLRKGGDGWNACVLKAIAGITGIGLTSLTKRAELRRRRSRLLFAAATFIIACGAFAAWDYTRTKISYYAQLSEQFGVPVGVHPIAARLQPLRNSTYRVESSKGKVRRASHVDNSGLPIIGDDKNDFWTADRKFSYREDGSLQIIEFFYDSKVLLRQTTSLSVFSSEEVEIIVDVKLAEGDKPIGADLYPGRASNSAMRIVYGKDGLPKYKLYLDAYRRPAPNAEGIGGEMLRHDERGLLVETTFLDAEKNPRSRKDGVQSIAYSRDRDGNIIATAYHGPGGKPAVLMSGVHKTQSTYDARGNILTTKSFGADGKKIISSEKRSYDGDGNVIEAVSFGARSTPVMRVEKYGRGARGISTEISYFDADGRPAPCGGGYDFVKRESDKDGKITYEAYFLQGKPCLNKEGYASMKWENGKRTLFGIDNKPVKTAAKQSGYRETKVSKEDEYGNATEVVLLNVEGKVMWIQEQKYDKRGNVTELNARSTDGELLHSQKRKYDDRGNEVEFGFFDEEGKPVLNSGYATVRKNYDERGNMTEAAYFGADGLPILTPDGYALERFKYDEQRNQIEVACFDTEGRPVSCKKGFAVLKRIFSEDGKVTEHRYDHKGRPVGN